MLTQCIDVALDRVHPILTGSARDRRDNPEAVAAVAAAVLAGIAFGFVLANPTPGVDDYSHLDMPFEWNGFWIGRGMWGGLLVLYLTPGGWITPFVSLVVGIVLQVLGAVLVGWALGVRALRPLQQTLLYASFAAFPYFAAQVAISFAQIAYPLATVLMVAGVLLALAGDARRAACGALAIGFALSIYQGSLSVLGPVALLAPLAGRGMGGREILRRYARVLVTVLAGGMLYLAAHRLILAVTGVVAQNAYYSVTFDWRFWDRWPWIREEIKFLFLGAGDVIPVKAVVVFLIAAALLAFALATGERRVLRRVWQFAGCVLLAVLLVASPFAVLFVHAGELAPRSAVGVAVIWFAVYAGLLAAPARAVRAAGTAGLVVTVALLAFHDNRMFYSQYLVRQADYVMMARIAERIDRLEARPGAPTTDVVVIGQYSHPPYEGMPRFKGDVLGFSQFEWDPSGSRWRIRGLAKAIGVDHYAWHVPEELGASFRDPALLRGRRPWPDRTSVFAHDGYAVVWLGEHRQEPRRSPLQLWWDSARSGTRRG